MPCQPDRSSASRQHTAAKPRPPMHLAMVASSSASAAQNMLASDVIAFCMTPTPQRASFVLAL